MGFGCSNTLNGGTTSIVKTMPHIVDAALPGLVKGEDILISKIAVIPSDVTWPTAVSILPHICYTLQQIIRAILINATGVDVQTVFLKDNCLQHVPRLECNYTQMPIQDIPNYSISTATTLNTNRFQVLTTMDTVHEVMQ